MRNPLVILMGVLILAGFVLYMITYTVRFSDAAIVTTFGKVGDNAVVDSPGLKFKLPAPLQNVTIYDKRAHVLSAQPETQQTRDNRQIVVSSFLTWRVADPLKFYQSYSKESSDARLQYRDAENNILGRLRSALSETSKYTLDELFTEATSGSRLDELERDVLRAVRGGEGDEGTLARTGIEVMLVGINRIELPESATASVFERMRTVRTRIAADATQKGAAEASTIRSNADAAAEKILAFARLRAAEIERRGQDEAAEWYSVLNQYPELAVLLTELEIPERTVPGKAKYILGPDSPGFRVFSPDFLAKWEARAAEDAARANGNASAPPDERLPAPAATTSEGRR